MATANPYAGALVGTLWAEAPDDDRQGQAELDRVVAELLNEDKWEGVDDDGAM
jgi:hypothetical protein